MLLFYERANESIQIENSEKTSSQNTRKSEIPFSGEISRITKCLKCIIFFPTVEGKVDFLQKNFQEILKKLDGILESHGNQEDVTVRTRQF